MDSTRSYLSRFSGLILFLVSLGVVGLLVFFTIRSARDTDQSANQNTSSTTTQSDNEPENNTDTTPMPAVTEEPAPTDTEEEAEEEEENEATSDDTDDGSVAAETDNLPTTGPESALMSAVALAVLAASIKAYFQSRRQLNDFQRR